MDPEHRRRHAEPSCLRLPRKPLRAPATAPRNAHAIVAPSSSSSDAPPLPQVRCATQHVEHESRTWRSAFNLSISLSSLYGAVLKPITDLHAACLSAAAAAVAAEGRGPLAWEGMDLGLRLALASAAALWHWGSSEKLTFGHVLRPRSPPTSPSSAASPSVATPARLLSHVERHVKT